MVLQAISYRFINISPALLLLPTPPEEDGELAAGQQRTPLTKMDVLHIGVKKTIIFNYFK